MLRQSSLEWSRKVQQAWYVSANKHGRSGRTDPLNYFGRSARNRGKSVVQTFPSPPSEDGWIVAEYVFHSSFTLAHPPKRDPRRWCEARERARDSSKCVSRSAKRRLDWRSERCTRRIALASFEYKTLHTSEMKNSRTLCAKILASNSNLFRG